MTTTNVGLASAGATTAASSEYDYRFPATLVIDGVRNVLGYATDGTHGFWNDANVGAYPDYVDVFLSGSTRIGRINIFQPAADLASEPVLGEYSPYANDDMTVQYSLGAGALTNLQQFGPGNTSAFVQWNGDVTLDRVRVVISSGGNGGYSRIAEVEVWTYEAPVGTSKLLGSRLLLSSVLKGLTR